MHTELPPPARLARRPRDRHGRKLLEEEALQDAKPDHAWSALARQYEAALLHLPGSGW